jgi:hypothetical protein
MYLGKERCIYTIFNTVIALNYISILTLNIDKKENKIFLISKEIQSGAVAMLYMRKGFLIYEEMRKYFPL